MYDILNSHLQMELESNDIDVRKQVELLLAYVENVEDIIREIK